MNKIKINSISYVGRNSVLSIFLTALILLVQGCVGPKSTTGKTEPVVFTEAPQWVNARPHSSMDYIGIGSCSKTTQPFDYQAIAKKNALNDLASEISVRVQGTTFLNSMEVNKNFSEEFISTISTSTDEKIENYEVAGIWENQKEYWVYYKLNKSEYQRQKALKKNQAMAVAYDFYSKGMNSEQEGLVNAAMDQYMRGLFALKDYWTEVNEYNTANQKIYLDREIYDRMRTICSGLSIRTDISKIVLSAENNYRYDLKLRLLYKEKPVKGISLTYSYLKTRYMKPKVGETNDLGEMQAVIEDISRTEKSNNLEVKINTEQFISKDLDLRIQQGIINSLKAESRQIPIEMITPSFSITSDEKSFGVKSNTAVLANAFNSELVKQGMRISGNGEINYTVDISANTVSGGQSQGFSVAFLEMQIVVKNKITGETVYQESLSNIKGLQLTNDAAGIEAYKKGKEKIESEIVKTLLDVIL